MDAAGHVYARVEFGRRLLDDTAGTASIPQAWPDRRPVLLAAVLLVASPTSAMLLYQHPSKPVSLWMLGNTTTAARSDRTGRDA